MQVQVKNSADKFGLVVPFPERSDSAMFDELDGYCDGIEQAKNTVFIRGRFGMRP